MVTVHCQECGFNAKSAAGLATHKRAKHPHPGGPNRKGVEQMLAILRRLGHIEDVDAARVQAVRSLADTLDFDSSNARMWQVYWDVIEDFMRADEHADSSLEQALAQIRSAGPMGNASET